MLLPAARVGSSPEGSRDRHHGTAPDTAALVVHTAWRVHRSLYRLSGARFLWTPANRRGWGGLHLTTTGRRTGGPRGVILGYLEDGDHLVLLAMNGWDEGDPAWWLSLGRHPEAVVRTAHTRPREFRARAATGSERARLRQRWVLLDPTLELLARQRSTDTPVIVLEPCQGRAGAGSRR